MDFSKDFTWGVATSSFQIEGAVKEDGRTESIWDNYYKDKFKVRDNKSGDVACDHYHRYKEDVKLIKDLGVKAYRFSTAWPRIMSYDSDSKNQGVHGIINEKGLDFYDRLIDELLENGIEPWLTLYHWDMPFELHRKGGWQNRDMMYWISEYSEVVTKRFSDRVTHFNTLNEMPCIIGGYKGWKAPGYTLNTRDQLNIIHNMLLAHGLMTRTIRENAKQKVYIGCAQNGLGNYPLTDSKKDFDAFIKAMECVESACDAYAPQEGTGILSTDSIVNYLDPIHFGKYPDKLFKIFKDDMPQIKDGDMELISTPTDFQAINIYEGRCIASGSKEGVDDDGWHVVQDKEGSDLTGAKWPFTPKCMNHYIKFISDRYKKPVYISENGYSSPDIIFHDQKVHDPQRIEFMTSYLENLNLAIKSGADVRGYFHWSLLDNYEWDCGYTERFGLVHMDYQTQKRTPKDSYYWYRDLINSFRK